MNDCTTEYSHNQTQALPGSEAQYPAIIAKLIDCQDVQTDNLPEPWAGIARILQACPKSRDQRADAFTQARAGLNGRAAEINAAVFAVDPKAPLPGDNDPWKAYTLADAYQERPPTEYIAGKLFELPSLNIVYGAPGTYKSFLLQDLAACVAAGLPWLPPAPWTNGAGDGHKTKKCPAMWIDFDNGERRTHNRFEALGRERNLPKDTPLIYYTMPNPWLYADKPEQTGHLAQLIKKSGAKIVVIDNLGNVTGEVEENSADMGRVMSHFRQLAEETGAAIVLIHHQRKGNGLSGRAGESLRGHSSIEASLDLALLVERDEGSESITIKATKVRGADILPFGAAFTYESKPDSEELQKAKFFGLDNQDNQSDHAVRREILAALAGGEKMNQAKLAKAVQETLAEGGGKKGINAVRNVIKRMVNEKQIKTTPGSKTNEVLYELQ